MCSRSEKMFLPILRYFYICIYLVTVINEIFCETCPPLESESVDFVCKYQGDFVPCGSPNVPGTKAALSCKHSYRIPVGNDPGYRELTCLPEGVWNRYQFNCIPECGTGIPHGKTFVINGYTAQMGAFPWHVGIYKRSWDESYEQICGGTLVSPSLVVSAAHCFFDEVARNITNVSRFAVAAGKFYRPYNITFVDVFAQKSSVEKIQLPERYFGRTRNYEQDIALVHLQNPFTLTALVRPVCMDWDNTYERQQLQSGKSGKIVGWGKTAAGEASTVLQEINLPYIHYENCIASVPEDFKGFVTADKFCAGYLNGSSLCEGDSGGGLCFQLDGRWYLRGVVSVGPVDRGTCDRRYYTAFTNVGTFLPWIQSAMTTVGARPGGLFSNTPITTGCVLPEQPAGGNFEIGSCRGSCDVTPGTRVPIGSFIAYKCNDDYTLKGYNISFCYEEGWHVPPTCVKTCPALRAKNMDIVCKYQDEIVSCDSAIVPGTSVTWTCWNFYKAPFPKDAEFPEITCGENGEWNHAMFNCVPECGVEAQYRNDRIVNGSLVITEIFPWSVYLGPRDPTDLSAEKPAGTLISPDLVITAASRYDGYTSNGKVLDEIAHGYFVNAYLRGPFRQSSQVESIEVAPGYAGNRGHYAHNIALVRLKTPFVMSAGVKPICISWNDTIVFKRRKLGGVWTNIQKSFLATTMTTTSNKTGRVELPYFTYEECLPIVQEKYRLYDDMFCMGCGKVSNICSSEGHGGDGFGCLSDRIWYLVGYRGKTLRVSDDARDDECEEVTTYTKIAKHLDWIRAAYNTSAGL